MSIIEFTETDKKVLATIRKYQNIKKTKISEIAEIPWTSANVSIDKMAKNNLIENLSELAGNEKKGLQINPKFAYFLGISIGTSHIKVSVLDFSFKYANKKEILDSLNHGSDFFQTFWDDNGFVLHTNENDAIWCAETPSKDLFNVKKLVNDLCYFAIELSNNMNILSITFSFPGHIDIDNNVIIKSSNLDFQLTNVGINTLFTSDTIRDLNDRNINIFFEHNVKAAAIAERSIGALKEQNGNCAVLYLGTGLGIAFWLDGHLYRGKTNAAGQLGHIKSDHILHENETSKCTCGNSGCLEQNIRDLFKNRISIKKSSGNDIANWLNQNESQKQELVNYLTQSIFNISNLLELDCIVFSGKLSGIYPSIEGLFQEKMIENEQTHMKVIPSNLGEFSASIGSAICGYYNCIGYTVE